ncbi:MAG TPA: aldehyde dehydrogenase family protein [Propionibacteriaceae bacterium]|nr:aldehyde dehydrogenase family protein [Propionibacteriaceae bacterium]
MARHWIDGSWVESGLVADSFNPATGELLGSFADGGVAEARAAAEAARGAFEVTDWGHDRRLRSRVLLELAELFEARTPELALMLTRENGKTLPQATGEVAAPAATLRHNAAQALIEVGTAAEVAPGQYFTSLAEPVGVVAIIVPWNAPVALFIRSLGPALAAGNTVAAKLPGQTALTNALMAEVVSKARSMPAGVVNMFTESGNTGAPFLVESADVDMVSFTGSVEVGRLIAAAGAKTLKRMNLELGGKTPMIVFDDAMLASTLPLLTAGVTTFAGQNCMAGSRILVQRGIADQVRERLADRLTGVVVGSGEEENTQMGPLIDSAAVARVDRIVEDSASYAEVIVRGGPVKDGPLVSGAFYRPSLIEVEDLDAPIIQQEIFGPVATFEVFDDEKEAIHRANATEFGLAAGVFTRDVDRARRVSRQINAGTVWTNTWFAMNAGFEEGGYKQSGIGRLRGARGLAEFQEIKTYVHLVPPVLSDTDSQP